MRSRRGFYESRVFPWLNDKLSANPEIEQLRAEAVRGVCGRVIEIGFGTGLNLPHYPAAVRALVGVEPNGGMQSRAALRIEASGFPVEVVPSTAECLPLPDVSFDSAVSVLTLCSVSDPARVLSELRRVLRDDGRLFVMEHGLSEDESIARWQNRLNRLQMTLACGCHLNRPIAGLIQSHGFRFEALRKFYVPGAPRTHGCFTVGTAGKA